jgi:uncharacterized delta-60 repeat protein
MKRLFCIASALLSGCGDNLAGTDAGMPDSSMTDAPPDSSTPFTPPTPFSFGLSATGPDQIQSAWPGPNGTFYAAGFAAATPTGDKLLTVTRRTATGAADTTFGTNGIVTTTVVARGANSEINVVTQSDGKIIVSTTTPAAVANLMDAADNDIALVRLATNGDLDTSFGVNGIRVVSFNESYLEPGTTPTVRGRDGVRRIAIGPNNQIFVHGYQRGEGTIAGGITPRVDTEFVVARFTADGALDLAYGGGDGKFVYDIFIAATNTHTSATPHVMLPLADGSAIAGGYANTPAVGSTVQPVLFKVNATGTALDTTWATQGLFHDSVLALQTEIYNVARHGDNLVSAGYGRNSGTANDWVSMRFNANTGVRDTTWGGTTNGAVVFDPSGAMLGSNCRNAIALPGGKTALVGSTGPGNMAVQDAVFAILDATGKLDTTFGTGIVKYMLGGNGNDQFWGGAVSGNNLLIVGYQGGGASPTTMNDDAYGVLVTLP